MKRLYLFDNIKVFLIIFVVIFHCLVPYTRVTSSSWITVLWSFVMSYTMPLFFAVSGYFYKRRTLKDNVLKYMYPCVLFSILLYAWGYFFYPPYKNGLSVGITGYAMWFLLAIFVYQTGLSLVDSYLQKTSRLLILLLLSIIVSLIAGAISYVGPFFQISRIIGHFPFFVLGIFLHRIEWLQKNHNKKCYAVMTCATFAVFLLLNLNYGLLGSTSFYSGYGSISLLGGGVKEC